jgi:MerR family gold-responsive transcriptional activator of gol and ges genes
VTELAQRAKALNEMADALKHLAAACEGNGRPECPIIKGLRVSFRSESNSLTDHIANP